VAVLAGITGPMLSITARIGGVSKSCNRTS